MQTLSPRVPRNERKRRRRRGLSVQQLEKRNMLSANTIDFASLPDEFDTNIATAVIAGTAEPGAIVELMHNGETLPSDVVNEDGVISTSVPLVDGANTLQLTARSASGDVLSAATKVINFNPAYSTAAAQLVYVDSVAPSLNGTIVIDVDKNAVLGLLAGQHVRGISPNASEVYMDDRSVVDASNHQVIRELPFSEGISTFSFLVSPDGTFLYSRTEIVDVSSNTLQGSLPFDISTGLRQWANASRAGGPTIAPNGGVICAQDSLRCVDLSTQQVTTTGIVGHFMSDVAFTPDGAQILVSEYSFGNGRLDVYDAVTFAPQTTIGGLGDFAGEIGFLDDNTVVVGSSGNPRFRNGFLNLIDLDESRVVQKIRIPLANNLAVSPRGEVFVSTGDPISGRLGVDTFVLNDSGRLELTDTFFLGINQSVSAMGRPSNDQIRKIVVKPARTTVGSVSGRVFHDVNQNGAFDQSFVVDQETERSGHNQGGVTLLPIYGPIGQEFVPEASVMNAVRLRLKDKGGSEGADILVAIREGSLSGKELGRSQIQTFQDGFGGNRFELATFEFATPLELVPGELYVIVVEHTRGDNFHAEYRSFDDPYDKGRFYFHGRVRPITADLWFQTGMEASEPGLAGIPITLEGTDFAGNSVHLTTTTATDDPQTPDVDETGLYDFGELLPGIYNVSQTAPPRWIQTSPTDSGAYTIEVHAGEAHTGLDFGIAPHVELADSDLLVLETADSDLIRIDSRHSGLSVRVNGDRFRPYDTAELVVARSLNGNAFVIDSRRDENDAALLAIVAEWAAETPTAQRISHLTGGGKANGDVQFRLGDDVVDDEEADLLIGGLGADLLFALGGPVFGVASDDSLKR